MNFLVNDPILIFQNGQEISARFVEEDQKHNLTVATLGGIGKVAFDNSQCKIELDYQEKLIYSLERSSRDNNYFKELYNYIYPSF